MTGIDLEIRMAIKPMTERGTRCAEIGRLLSLPVSNVRDHFGRIRSCVVDGHGRRQEQPSSALGGKALA